MYIRIKFFITGAEEFESRRSFASGEQQYGSIHDEIAKRFFQFGKGIENSWKNLNYFPNLYLIQ